MTTAQLLGSVSVGTLMPTALAALAGATAALELPLIDLEAQLVGAASAAASISIQPPSIELAAAIEGAIQLPGVAIDVSVMASLAASLNLKIGELALALSAILALNASFGTAGVYAWKLQGQVVKMGPDLSSQLAGGIPGLGDPNAEGFGVVLLAQDGGAIAALQALFAL